jgi:hypothetical protein
MLQKIYKTTKRKIRIFFYRLSRCQILHDSHEVVYLNFPREITLSSLNDQLRCIEKRHPKAQICLKGLESVRIIDE